MLREIQVANDESPAARWRGEAGYQRDTLVPVREEWRSWRAVAEANTDSAIDFIWLLRILRRNVLLLGGVFAVSLMACLSYFALATPQFRATAQLYIETRETPFIQLRSNPQPPAETAFVESQLEIAQSPAIVEHVLRRLAGNSRPMEEGLEPTRPDATHLPVATAAEITALSRKLSVTRKGSTNILEVSFTDPDRERAADVVNALLSTYLEMQVKAARATVGEKKQALQEQVATLREEVRQAEEKLQAFQVSNDLAGSLDDGVGRRQLADLVAQLATVHAQREVIAARLAEFGPTDAISRKNPETGTNAEAVVQTQTAQGAAPDAMAWERRTLGAQLESATRRAMRLEEAQRDLGKRIAEFQERTIELGEIERQANAAKAVYSLLLAQLRETEAQENLVLSPARVVYWARPPAKPSKPDKPMMLLIFLAGGLGAGVLLMSWREMTSDAFRSVEDLENTLGRRPIAQVPYVEGIQVSPDKRNQAKKPMRSAALTRARPQVFALSGTQEALDYAQALFLIRSSILQQTGISRTVAITSPEGGGGKSSLALNLGAYAASAGMTPLVVDCDTRKPDLSDMLLTHGRTAVPAVDKAANAQGGELRAFRTEFGFDFCAAADALPAGLPMEKTSAPELREFIAAARHDHDLILIDTTSLNDCIDARPLIAMADLVLLVFDWSRTTRRAAVEAMSIITEAGGKKTCLITREPKRHRYSGRRSDRQKDASA